MNLKEIFGLRVKELREKILGLSQEQFAERIGIHRNSLSKIENGSNFAKPETIEKIQKVLGLSYPELFNFSENNIENERLKILIAYVQELNDADIDYFIATIKAYIQAKHKN